MGSFSSKAVALATLGSFLFGYPIANLNASMPYISLSLKFCGDQTTLECDNAVFYRSVLNTAVFVGAAIGCFVAARLADNGRRFGLLVTHCMFIIGFLASALAYDVWSFIGARLWTGLCVGLVTVSVPLYIAEMSPKQSRGFYGVMHQLALTIGILAAIGAGLLHHNLEESEPESGQYILSEFDEKWWRITQGLGVGPAILAIFLLGCVYTFETPQFNISRKREVAARQILARIVGEDEVEEELAGLLENSKDDGQDDSGVTFGEALRNPNYRHALFIATMLSAFQQLTGINVFVSASNSVFMAAGVAADKATLCSVGMAALNTTVTVIAAQCIEPMGRKLLLTCGCALQAVFLIIGAAASTFDFDPATVAYMSVVAVLGFFVAFAFALGPVVWVYIHEIFPREYKTTAAAFASAANWVCTVAIVFSAEYMSNATKYWFYGIMSVIATFFCLGCLHETRGRSLEDSPYFQKKGDSDETTSLLKA